MRPFHFFAYSTFAPLALSVSSFNKQTHRHINAESLRTPSSRYVIHSTGGEINAQHIKSLLSDDESSVECIIVDNFCKVSQLTDSIDYSYLKDLSSTEQGSDIRNDRVMWISNNNNKDLFLLNERKALSGLADIFSIENLVLKPPSKVQLSCYDKHSKYVPHRDNIPRQRLNIDDNYNWISQPEQLHRYLTCILYLTPTDWNISCDGGALRCFFGCNDFDDIGETSKEVFDIEPKTGRLVVFRSDKILHEVRPTQRSGRIALTAWIVKSGNF